MSARSERSEPRVQLEAVAAGGRGRRLRRAVVAAARAAGPAAVLVRVLVFVTALLALLLAWPPATIGVRAVPLLVALALVAALAPGGPLPAVAIGAAALGWFLRSGPHGGAAELARTGVLAALLYLVHSGAALGAVLPYDTVLHRGVLLPWLRRTGLVLVLTAFFGLVVGVIVVNLAGLRYPLLSLAGLAVLAWLLVYLARLARRR